MNMWAIVIIVASLLAIAGIVLVNVSTAQGTEKISCASCGNACTTDSNCGIVGCGAVSGGTCGCKK